MFRMGGFSLVHCQQYKVYQMCVNADGEEHDDVSMDYMDRSQNDKSKL